MNMTPEQAREILKDAIVEDGADSLRDDPAWRREILRKGFSGYNNYTTDELAQAVNDAGLVAYGADPELVAMALNVLGYR